MLKLYYAPGSSSMASHIALEEAVALSKIEEAQRMLQVVQLQLVFRPAAPAGQSLARSQGAGEIGKVLAALAVGDTGQAARFLDQAIGAADQGGRN